MSGRAGHGAAVQVAAGARAAEALLLRLVAPLVAAARADPRLLAKPVRIVVPSHSLRDHLAGVLVRQLGGALAGVQVQTLAGLAREVLERTGAHSRDGDVLVPILVRAAAREEPVLAGDLGRLHDGFGVVVASVRDLLDAGLGPEHAPAAEELLAALKGDTDLRLRAAALVRVAAGVGRRLAELGIDSRGSFLRRAREALEGDPERALPQRAVLVHGFVDATGLATDLIVGLVARCGARLVLDRSPDPADPERRDPGWAFGARFAARLQRFGAADAEPAAAAPLPHLLVAPGGEAEVRGVAVRVRALLDAGAPPEGIGVVARALAPFTARIRGHFHRLGIPFSTRGAHGGLDGVGRRVRALLELIERRDETPVDRWLDLVPLAGADTERRSDLRLALHLLGAARLGSVATLALETCLEGRDSLPLPVRHGILLVSREGDDATPRAVRRRVSRSALDALVSSARRAGRVLASWPGRATIAEHLESLRALVSDGLGWRGGEPAHGPVTATLERLAQDLPQDVVIDGADLLLLLHDAFAEVGVVVLGGAGAGVQVLDAMQARGRTFEHLFVLGLNRDVFPRIVLEDPLLPDSLRRALSERGAGVLPDLPHKQDGFDEERALFAQLLSSSAHVTLSWQSVDDDGRERAASTLVEGLRLAQRAGAPERLPTVWAPVESPVARPAGEHAVLAGLHGSRSAVAAVLPVALAEAVREGAAHRAAPVAAARARLATLEAFEPRGPGRAALGPFFGFVGERRPGDEREGPIAVTTLEALARCPWQAFLARTLHVEPGPDALEALPAVDAAMLGVVLHESIQTLVETAISSGEESIEAALARGALAVGRPSDTRLRRLLRDVSREVLARSGLSFDGLAEVLADRARPLVEEVLTQVWCGPDGDATLLGAELTGTLSVHDDADRPRVVGFRADLVEARSDALRGIDLKSGKPLSSLRCAEKRRRDLRRAIAAGGSLQAAVYACALQGEGAYLFADPERTDGQPFFSVSHDDPELVQALDRALRTLLEAWDRGSFLPRLELPEGARGEPPCAWCQVSEACVRGDSGARMRVRRWGRGHDAASGAAGPALAAARAVFELPRGGKDEAGGEEP